MLADASVLHVVPKGHIQLNNFVFVHITKGRKSKVSTLSIKSTAQILRPVSLDGGHLVEKLPGPRARSM